MIATVFIYTTIANIIERPEGVKIASCFIGAIIIVSFLSRVMRAFELRGAAVHLDETARALIRESGPGPLPLVANEPHAGDPGEYRDKTAEELAHHHIPDPGRIVFLEVTVTDPSDRTARRRRPPGRLPRSTRHQPRRPQCDCRAAPAHPGQPGSAPHIYFDWTEGNPVVHLLRYLAFGVSEVAPVTREILRQAEHDPGRRPVVHVA